MAEPDTTLDVKEQAVHEERVWVRTTFACNNRCIFCLDGDVPPRGHRDKDEVMDEIRERFVPGARLIVSGGEASIHPNFMDFVAYGKELGYNWIQTITNGRMFAYPKFANEAAQKGLSEATFSMHGHNSELHDELTGIQGGFSHALRGMVNLLKTGTVVVNVDVVINGLNYKYLDDILKFYMKLGIHEFDLLQVVPFGRAWWPQNRERMFYNVEEAFPYLNKAFKHAFQPGNYIWTNRFPVAFLEDIEELIQDPHKLFDEVRGRQAEFNHFIATGAKLQCWPERCEVCFLKDFCAGIYELRRRLDEKDFVRLIVDLTDGDGDKSPETVAALCKGVRLARLDLHAENAEQASEWLAAQKLKAGVTLWLDDYASYLAAFQAGALPKALQKVDTLVVARADDFTPLRGLDIGLVLRVTSETADVLLANKDTITARDKTALWLPSVETLTQAHEQLPDPAAFFAAFADAPLPSFGVPACIHPMARSLPPALRLTSLAADGTMDMTRATRDYIRHDYVAKSNRCKDCPEKSRCAGLHINTLRVHRFKQLKPERITGK